MTFLNPLALFALAAAAIPLIVHLFNFRRPRRVDFSSLVFLREFERSTMQRVRIRQWLLLLLRTLAIACLVLAFAQPTLTGRMAGALGDRASGPIAIVIDNSLSMTTVERSGERFRTARDAALRIIEEVGGSNEIVIITTSDGAVTQRPTSQARATDVVAELAVRPWSMSIGEAIVEAAAALSETSSGTGEIFVVSDLQQTMLADLEGSSMSPGLSITLVPVGSRIPSNLALTRVDVAGTAILEVGQPVRVEATVTNFSTSDIEELPVSLYLGDERVAQAVVSTPAGGSETVPLVFAPRDRGWQEGRVVIEDEAFTPDNTRFFTLNIPERRRILVVRGSEQRASHLMLALAPEVSDSRILFEHDVVASTALSGQSLGAYDAVVLAGVTNFSSGEVGMVANFVEGGGGLLIYPGAGSDLSSYNNLLTRLEGGTVNEIAGSPGSGSAIAEVGAADLEHPLFQGVFEDGGNANIEQTSVFAAMRYDAGSGREQTVLSLSNGWPLIQEIRSGSGTTLFAMSGFEPAWNELAVRGLFVPLVYRSLFYLSASEMEMGDGLALSDDFELRLGEREGDRQVLAVSPTGDEFVPDQRSVFGTRRVSISGTAMLEPGFARIVDADSRELRHLIAVNLDPAESDPRLIAGAEAASILHERFGAPVQTIDLADGIGDVAGTLREARRGVEIWNVFLLLALGFLVAEMLVAKRWKPDAIPA